jgi:hypothetical protein
MTHDAEEDPGMLSQDPDSPRGVVTQRSSPVGLPAVLADGM